MAFFFNRNMLVFLLTQFADIFEEKSTIRSARAIRKIAPYGAFCCLRSLLLLINGRSLSEKR